MAGMLSLSQIVPAFLAVAAIAYAGLAVRVARSAPHNPNNMVSFFLFLIAGITDFLDGYFARKLDQTSRFGAALDPIADKLLTSAALFLLVATDTLAGFHIVIALSIILREIWVSGLREALAGKAALPVIKLAKWKTALQFIALTLLISPIGGSLREIGIFALWAAAGMTILTGMQYTRTAFSILRT